MKQSNTTNIALTVFILALTIAGSPAQILSATISATSNPETISLDTLGTTDWVQFGINGTSGAFDLQNEKSGGSGGVDTVSAVTSSGSPDSLPGQTQTTSTITTSYANGTSPVSSTSTATIVNSEPLGGQTSSAGNFSISTGYNGGAIEIGSTLSFTITFNNAISNGNVYLVANSFSMNDAALTLSLSNGNSQTITTGNPNGNENDLYDISLSNVTAGSSLEISYEMVQGGNLFGGGFDNISLQAVAVSVPEPKTWVLLFSGILLLLGARRFTKTSRC